MTSTRDKMIALVIVCATAIMAVSILAKSCRKESPYELRINPKGDSSLVVPR